MRWTARELMTYTGSKEYIDTALIPLVPVTFGNGLINSGNASEIIQRVSFQVEKQFKGRILLLPPVIYKTDISDNRREVFLQEWFNELEKEQFSYILFIGTDEKWRNPVNELRGEYILLPVIPFEHMEEPYITSLVSDQVEQLMPRIVELWQK